jgi:general secretion pathway protein M
MNEQLARLRDWFDKLGPRERRLMSALGVAFAGFLLLLVPIALSLTLSSRRETNKALADAISSIRNAREDIQKKQERRDAVVARYANRAPPLAALLEKAARDNRLEIPESRDLPEVPHGKKYVERGTVVRLRKSGMLQLSKMLEQIEQQRLPVSVSRLNIRRRGGERDSYDVELGVSAYDRNEPVAGGAK